MVVRSYTFVDYATQGYVAVVGSLILCCHDQTVPHWRWLFVGHLVVLVSIHCLIVWHARKPAAGAVSFFRHFYPVLLYAGFYAETGVLDQMFVQGFLDPVVIGWDQALFGCQPSLVFMQKLPYLAVSELFYAAYFSYYLMIGGVGIILYLQNRQQFCHYVSVVSFVFYICYVIFIFVPVIGPPVFFRNFPGYHLPPNLEPLTLSARDPVTIQSGLFYRLMKWIYKVFESPGAAIPSSHVAVALCTVFFSFRYIRLIRWWHLCLAVLLCLATVYCHYHYVSDVLAGIFVAVLLIPTANWLYLKFDSHRGGASTGPPPNHTEAAHEH
jgi:membrane-associated phospholipid phosphatase